MHCRLGWGGRVYNYSLNWMSWCAQNFKNIGKPNAEVPAAPVFV